MNLSAPFLARPTATLLVTVALVLAGVAAYRELPITALPKVDFAAVAVESHLPGADAELTSLFAESEIPVVGPFTLHPRGDGGGSVFYLLPGLESPSVIPLAHEHMVAVHAVVAADEVHGLLGKLKAAGASGILVIPVEKLLP